VNSSQVQNAVAQPHAVAWGTGRLAVLVVALFIGQVGFILLFAEREKPVQRQTRAGPRVLLVHEHVDVVALAGEPTLFAWAGPHTFSGQAWFRTSAKDYPQYKWTEPPAFFELRPAQLVGWFESVINENNGHTVDVAEKIVPDFNLHTTEPTPMLLRDKSTLAITGDIAARRFRSQFDLPSWHANDVLRPTMVRVVVDANGQVHSATLLSQSGSEQADKFALDIAKSAEWEPLPESRRQPLGSAPTGLTSGTMIFYWHTTPGPATNTPPKSN